MTTQTTDRNFYLHLYHGDISFRCFPCESVEQAVEAAKFIGEKGLFPDADNWVVCDENAKCVISDGSKIFSIAQ